MAHSVQRFLGRLLRVLCSINDFIDTMTPASIGVVEEAKKKINKLLR